MGKSTKRKQEAQLARQPDYNSLFLASKRIQAQKEAEAASFDPMVLIRGYEDRAIRSLNDFNPRTRSLNKSTRGRELVRYAFNKYSPPEFLYNVWDSGVQTQEVTNTYLFGTRENFREWYLALAQGKSLYKECTMGLLTKRETHYFSICPYPFTIPEAIWYSVIRCIDESKPAALARKIASTKISGNVIDDFWKGVARWFMNKDISIRQMNDLLDYISNRHRENAEWYIRDQTLHGLQKAMRSWHREMYRTRAMVVHYKQWKGVEVADMDIVREVKKTKTIWNFHQITTGAELAQEGNKQHHCVSSYGARCNSGDCSIWSLTQRDQFNSSKRALTIEVLRNGSIVQARGYANRSARPEELIILRDWANKTGFRLKGVVTI